MTRFLFYTDLHLTSRSPVHRIDDYRQAILGKLSEVYLIAEQRDCEFVVFGGDFFDTHRVFSYDLINLTMEIICESQFKTYGILGQHDLNGYNPQTFKSSALSFVMKHCDKFSLVEGPLELDGLWLVPSHVWMDVMEDCKVRPTGDKPSVLIAHHLLSRKKQVFDVVVTSDMDSVYDLVLSGDLHSGFDVHKIGNTTFCNPGSIGRLALNDAHRMPQVAIVEIGDGVEIEYVPLQTAGKGETVFGKEFIEGIRKAASFDSTSFIQQIEGLEREVVDVYDLIWKTGIAQGKPRLVLEYIMTKKTENP